MLFKNKLINKIYLFHLCMHELIQHPNGDVEVGLDIDELTNVNNTLYVIKKILPYTKSFEYCEKFCSKKLNAVSPRPMPPGVKGIIFMTRLNDELAKISIK